ncbi:MAG: hypothetical protein Tp185DCM00d2C31949991_55 [Prokaryotic dsDNA virus sp.]|nr:MAG: hypothetical protein Tp162SUR1511541_32 [Prokaryotic dsDNA virus sp.]QDP56767.1 MAG: hypothetical protein Tp185DCM00d2C31949991_55 [Prokaryotic dsDNA virus sp.]QDP63784.1 MAG: hypothetical protein Unbinned2480contig1002_38 [Prokaryotic dsDNA virus sp.]QDP63872.1 MAG: hypothetical protein GOVbin2429_56 [Prokaryotic dsDNA virus sp.]
MLGVGVNDSEFCTSVYVDGKQIVSPAYSCWMKMLNRCYSEKYKELHPSYCGCLVHPDWLKFSVFERWFDNEFSDGMCLDKDLFGDGSTYSEDNCVFISQRLNSIIRDFYNSRDVEFAHKLKSNGTYQAKCHNGKKQVHLGTFHREVDAISAYAKEKGRQVELALVGEPRARVVDRVRFMAGKFLHKIQSKSLIEQNAELHKELAKLKAERVFVVNNEEGKK